MPAPAGTHDAEPQGEIVAWLESGEGFPDRASVSRVDTHASHVFLAGDRAWKLKRSVRFPYLDFSTPEKRKAALDTELRLNRRTAPKLYRAVHPVTRDDAGRYQIDGRGETVDWVLEMLRFPDDALLDIVAARGALDDPLLLRLTDDIVDFHGEAERYPGDDGAALIGAVIEGNAKSMAKFPKLLDPSKARDLSDALRTSVERNAALLDGRARAGRIRHCHGDLHLRNIALIDGVPTLFDCLEFDDRLATTDVLYDLAFLLMDLWERGLQHAANIMFNRYLDRSAEDESAVGLIAMFMAVRASVRAHVLAAQHAQSPGAEEIAGRARHYLDLGLALIAPEPVRLVAIGGLSGTGKSTLARAIGGSIGKAPGARILRSDVLRKRLAGVRSEVRLPPESYTAQASRQVYDKLERLAGAALGNGQSVIADAMFTKAQEREAMAAIATDAGCAFDGLWLRLPDDARFERVEMRSPEASDADIAVARAQAEAPPLPPAGWIILDSGGPLDALRAKACAALRLSS